MQTEISYYSRLRDGEVIMTDKEIIRLAYESLPDGQWDEETLKRYAIGFVNGFKKCLKMTQEAIDE